MHFLSVIGIFVLLSASCTSVNQAVRPSHGTELIDPGIKKHVAGSGSIHLLEHQLLPIDYLKKHPDMKGLLVNHYMGTGKTYLGIGFAQLYPDRPVIILAPRFLQSNWTNSIESYGASNQKRFSFVSYEDAPAKLAKMDLTKHLILADEVHNLVKKMRSIDAASNAKFTEVYTNLRTAYKIIGLTGTPVYSDESDIAFLLDLVSGQDLMPFNQETFRLQYTRIMPTRQYFRGYLTESMLVVTALPIFMSAFIAAAISPFAALAGIPVGLGLTVGVNHLWGPPSFKLRELDVIKMAPILHQYVSYFRFADTHFKDFPGQDFKIEEVPYNKYQYSFFLRLVEGDLPVDQLQRLLLNEHIQHSDEYVKINSTAIHEQVYSSIGAGRDIGNFDFRDPSQKLVEAPKFVRIYDQLIKNNEPTVIYSNYYQTGILAFEKFLERQGYNQKYAIIEPSMPMNQVNDIVASYNRGDTKLLMLHPEVTEGISLKGTQYLHILEPMLNSTVLEQVVGRTRRFQSHSHLPKDKQLVKVRMWQSTSSNWNPEIGGLNRVNWYKRYRELSYMSSWGIGISQIDKKLDRKALNPEELALIKLNTLEKNLKEIQAVLTTQSIENSYQLPKSE
jgi:hypothetical protein